MMSESLLLIMNTVYFKLLLIYDRSTVVLIIGNVVYYMNLVLSSYSSIYSEIHSIKI